METRFEPVDTENEESDYDDGRSDSPEEGGSNDDKPRALLNAKDTPDQYEYFKVRDVPPTEHFYTLFPSSRSKIPRSKNRIARQETQLHEFPMCSWYCKGNVNLAKKGTPTCDYSDIICWNCILDIVIILLPSHVTSHPVYRRFARGIQRDRHSRWEVGYAAPS